ncbi:conserved hypothetical protein [Mycoplasmopsis pulmonis]|uniref:Membrane protein insertase YidC n=1 Tax=Mycoplasmopsis pulmonis (strain UAB CTIP) TaxID=272635 RepID=YIDC_MYCPU|nr:membrane protein insertase YidC [Mycoplasmopsis pulmonis]Q98R58.3 RecName: Full=Membrane protein insertase YidC; AltName: Full=Foldase YidC; AltName: Full=Membrane integrase YidC; AltName: Full=Membrane protein YidC [Mycoplasmopsis pulmonis UAB CTIP]CAC13325.1 conserved hypothetical protein [Mycoplasmopsis pulmonis]
MKRENRSKKYDYFNSSSNNSNKFSKTNFKKYFKIFKLVVYIFLIGLALTGCIQSFVVQSSPNVGAGLELYPSKDKVAPRVNVYKKEENGYVKDRNINELLKDEQSLQALKDFSKNHNGVYGKTKSSNSALAILEDNTYIDSDGQENKSIIYKDNSGKYLFFNDTLTTYDPINKFTDIYAIGRLTERDSDAIKFRENNPKIIEHLKLFKVSEVPISREYQPNIKFARDFLQALYDKTLKLPVYQNILRADGSKYASFNEFLTSLEKRTTNHLKTQLNKQELSEEDLNSITLSDSESAALNAYLTRVNPLISENGFTGLKKSLNNADDFELVYSQGEKIAQSDYGQIPVVTWGEYWNYGPFYALLVAPIASFTNWVASAFESGFGIVFAIIVVVVVTRLFIFGLTFKVTFSQYKQQELQGKKAKIDAKYAAYENNKMMKQRKQKEIQDLYKKHNISPIDFVASIAWSSPLFIAVWRVIQSVPVIKSNFFLGVNFSTASYQEILAKNWVYLWVVSLALIVQIISQILPRWLAKKKIKERANVYEMQSYKKNNKTQNIMLIVFMVFTITLQAGVQIYWIIGGLWTIGQTLFVHHFQKTSFFKNRVRPWLDRH